MKKDFGVKTWLCPMPVLMVATFNEDGSPNVMTAAWIQMGTGHLPADALRQEGRKQYG